MFCDGKCKKGKKTCGMLLSVSMKNELTQQSKIIEQCAVIGIFESMVRQEQGQVRIQAAVESGRNESAKWMRNQNETLATGFLGILYATQDDEEAARKIKYLANTRDQMIAQEKKEETDIIEGEIEDGSV
jgi:hypothetical protein